MADRMIRTSKIGSIFGMMAFGSMLFAQSDDGIVYLPDSSRRVLSNLLGYVQKDWHISVSYGQSYLETQGNVIRAYRNSGYVSIVGALHDPDKPVRDPKVLTIAVEKNVTARIQAGVQYTQFYRETVSGSNWIATESIPDNHLDVVQNMSSRCFNIGMRYLMMPLNLSSRMELTTGLGINYNTLALKGHQYFIRVPRNSTRGYDATSSSYSFNGRSAGVYADLTFDFYWSKWISSQFKIERRFSSDITVPEKVLEYSTLDPRTHVTTGYRQVLRPQSMDYSGFILTTSLRFHF